MDSLVPSHLTAGNELHAADLANVLFLQTKEYNHCKKGTISAYISGMNLLVRSQRLHFGEFHVACVTRELL